MDIETEFGVVEIVDIMDKFSAYSFGRHGKNSKASRISRKQNRDAVLFTLALNNGNDEPECFKCGFSDVRALQIDHVNGGGATHYRKFRNNRPKYYRSMLDHLEDFQILCANCNVIKVIENSERDIIVSE